MTKTLQTIREAVKAVHDADALIAKIDARAGELGSRESKPVDALEMKKKELLGNLAIDENETDRQELAAVVEQITAAEKDSREVLEMQAGLADKRAAALGGRESALNTYRNVYFPYLEQQAIELNKEYFAAANELLRTFKRLAALGELCKSHAVGFASGNERLNLSIPLFNLAPTNAIRTASGTWEAADDVRQNAPKALFAEHDALMAELTGLGLIP